MDFRINWFTWLWVLWILAGLSIEVIALWRSEPYDTLSEHVWWLFCRRPVWIWVVVGFLLWSIVHFVSRGRLA